MSKYWKILLVGLVWMLAIGVGPSAAQGQVTGVITNINGDLWVYDPATDRTQRLTEWGYNGAPHLSPDGTRVAYRSVTEAAVNAGVQRYAGTPAMNIWLLDRRNGDFRRVAGQDATGGMVRSEPAWSPDGTQLAWTQLRWNPQVGAQGQPQLVVHDLNTGAERVLNDNLELGMQDGGLFMPPVQWGGGGIAYRTTVFVEDVLAAGGGLGSPFDQVLELYDPASGAMTAYTLGRFNMGDNSPDMLREILWAEDNGQPVLVMHWDQRGWTRFEPQTGAVTPLADTPLLVERGRNVVQLRPILTDVNGAYRTWRWEAILGRNNEVRPLDHTTDSLQFMGVPSISGGQAAHVNRQGEVFIWGEGSGSRPVMASTGRPGGYSPPRVAWQPTHWVIAGNQPPPLQVTLAPTRTPLPAPATQTPVFTPPPPRPTATIAPYTPAPSVCPTPNRQIFEGATVEVAPGPPNNLRSTPSTRGQLIGRLAAGTRLLVTQGPTCAEGLNWYFVRNSGGEGWTAGGDGSRYWLVPLSIAPTATPYVPPTGPTCQRINESIYPGVVVQVRPGAANNWRQGPSLSSPVLGEFPGGTVLEVQSQATCADGINWYRVQFSEGTGWTAGGQNGAYWLDAIGVRPTPTIPAPTRTPIPPPNDPVCQTPNPELGPGVRAQVAPGVANNFRAAPTTNSRVLGIYPAGSVLDVLEGPVCADGINWYRVQSTESGGWTAGGQGGSYWLQRFG